MSLVLNEYPPSLVLKQFYQCFHCNNAISILKKLDANSYCSLHKKLLNQPTRREKQLNVMLKDAVTSPTVLKIKEWDKSIMYPCYLFDTPNSRRPSKQFYKWWTSYYANDNSSFRTGKVRLVANTNKTVKSYLIHKKPQREKY